MSAVITADVQTAHAITGPETAIRRKHADEISAVNIPFLRPDEGINIKKIRDKKENLYLAFIWLTNALIILGLLAWAYSDFQGFVFFAVVVALFGAMSWISWKLFYWTIYGHGIVVTSTQYPQIYRVVKEACDRLKMPTPTIIVLQGHGMFELMVARRFTRRGLIIITSNMVDEFSKKPTSREFMMFVGRQLGHIKAGRFKLWFFKDVIGIFSVWFYLAWRRRCHFTADRIGLLIAGDLYAAEQALYMITVGAGIAPSTSYDDIVEQRTHLFESFWAWIGLGFSSYPYMIDRTCRLRQFAELIFEKPRPGVGALQIDHQPLRSLPLLIIHGRDRMALLELKDFLYSHFPYVSPTVMVSMTTGALTLPEKFESLAAEVRGAIALITPDDIGGLAISDEATAALRARQNVVVEIGWIWGKLGRRRCLLLVRGQVEIPSGLSGVDLYSFHTSPSECGEAMRSFIKQLELEAAKA